MTRRRRENFVLDGFSYQLSIHLQDNIKILLILLNQEEEEVWQLSPTNLEEQMQTQQFIWTGLRQQSKKDFNI